MSLLLAGWWLGFGVVQAQDPSPPRERSRDHWITVDRRSRSIYKVGIAVGATGLGLDLLGLVTGSEALVAAGGVGELAGAPIMTAASLRSARALQELGGTPERAWGYAGWGLVGADVGFRIASAATTNSDPETSANLALLAVLAEIGAYTSAVLQQFDNNSLRKDLGLRATGQPHRRRFRAVFAPMGGRAAGMTVVLVRR
ncbi:MAG: hypothetical protein AAF211_25465 [Myxococcota bacterium]